MVLVAVLGICSLNASEAMAQKPATSLQKQDMELLFGANANSVNVSVLSEEDMKAIRGEFLSVLAMKIGIGVGIGLVRYGYCRWRGGSGCPFQVNVSYPLN